MNGQAQHPLPTRWPSWRALALWLTTFAPARLLAEAPCAGECNGDESVTVHEVVALVRVLLNEVPVSTCGSGDGNGDGEVTVNEIVVAVNRLLGGCGSV